MAFEELKRGTQDLHRRLEQAVDIESACSDLRTYRDLLSRLLGYYEPMEDELSRVSWDLAGLDFAARRKTAWLHHDLAFLGITQAEQAELPRCSELPRPGSMAAALGAMYVLEGATLGGQIIVRLINKSLGLAPPLGAGFYAGYGLHNGSMWLSFKAVTLRHLESRASIEEAVHTARETFTTYEAWLRVAAEPSHRTLDSHREIQRA